MLDSVILKLKNLFSKSILLQLCMEPEYDLTPEQTVVHSALLLQFRL